MNTNETCISYFARVYGIDFTETEGGMKDVVAFCYSDYDGWDKVQAILDSLPGRN